MSKTIKKLYLPLLVAFVAVLTSCSNEMGELSSDHFTVTPQVLEAVDGKVPATINGRFSEKYFKKKAVVEVVPVLRWEGGEAKGQPAVFQGEKVEGNDQTISYKAGGNYTMKTSFGYVPEMAKSELHLEFKAKVGKKEATIPAVRVADGVISISELIGQILGSTNFANGDDAFQRIIKEKYDVNIMFLIQQVNVRVSESKTAKAFNEEVKNIDEAANKKINNIEISTYTLPDGGVESNTGSTEDRQNSTTKTINKDLKKGKIEATVDTKHTVQDWEGLQELVSKSNIQDKELTLRALPMYSDPEQREQETKNISSVYKTLAEEILPQLRRPCLTSSYNVIGKSDGEIAALADSDARQSNTEELLYVATLANDPAKQGAISTKATQIYPNDHHAYSSLGKLAYQADNLDKAEGYSKKSLFTKDSAEVNMNMDLIALAEGDKTAAGSYLGKASGAKELNEALGNLYAAQGQYDRAVNAFDGTKTDSAVLVQILVKDYNKAKNTLSSVAKLDACTDYLVAVTGARTNNTSMVTKNLKKAVAKDSSLAKKAASDLKLSKHFTSVDFMNIIK